MIQTLAPIAVAFASALTFVAYKHPDGYSRLLWAIRAAEVSIFIAAVSWERGMGAAARAFAPMIDTAKEAEAQAMVGTLQAPIPYILAGVAVAFLYAEAIALLPIILAEKKPK